MALPQNITSYFDVKQVLEAALRTHGARYSLPKHGDAVRWRLRAYKYRSLLREQLGAGVLVPGYVPETPYDDMILTLEDNVVLIKFGRPMGNLETLEGEPINTKQVATVDDPLMAEAEALARRLTGDDE